MLPPRSAASGPQPDRAGNPVEDHVGPACSQLGAGLWTDEDMGAEALTPRLSRDLVDRRLHHGVLPAGHTYGVDVERDCLAGQQVQVAAARADRAHTEALGVGQDHFESLGADGTCRSQNGDAAR